eukprot:3286983-Karenia_brevis.AAC.1
MRTSSVLTSGAWGSRSHQRFGPTGQPNSRLRRGQRWPVAPCECQRCYQASTRALQPCARRGREDHLRL